jgi:CRP/FNR family transcriptional regulator, anaerobic regulatory protein
MKTIAHKVECHNCRLAGTCVANGLNKDEIGQLEAIICHKRPLKPDEYLYRQNDQTDSLFVVRSGSFRSTFLDVDGTEQTDNFYLPGEAMGLDALQKSRSRYSVVALETATVCELPLVRLNALCANIPSLQSQLLRVIGSQIASDHDRIALLGNRSASGKLAAFLLMLSGRYRELGYSATEFNLSMPRHDIADFLSLTMETVSRQLSNLVEKGIINVKRRGIQIKNLDSLKAIV